MHVHKEKIKELASINDATDKNRAVDAYSFLVYVKSKIPSSIIYGYFSKMNRAFLVKRLGLDYRTIEKGFKLLIEHELTKRSGVGLFAPHPLNCTASVKQSSDIILLRVGNSITQCTVYRTKAIFMTVSISRDLPYSEILFHDQRPTFCIG